MLSTTLTAQAIDDVLAGSFPASDPPAWTPGMARPAPEIAEGADSGTPQDETNDLRASGVIDVSRPTDPPRPFVRRLVPRTAAAGLAVLAPIAILAVAAPVALGIRGVVEVAERLAAIVR